MKKSALVLALIALAATSLAVAAATASVTTVKSTVTITSGEGALFAGKVKAAQKKCRAGRKVKLFMEPYSGGADELVGTAKTSPSGAWMIKGNFLAGVYHAQVTAATVHAGDDTFHCRVDLSVSARY